MLYHLGWYMVNNKNDINNRLPNSDFIPTSHMTSLAK